MKLEVEINEKNLEKIFFKIMEGCFKYHILEHAPVSSGAYGFSKFNISFSSEEEEKEISFTIISSCNNRHRFKMSAEYKTIETTLIYEYQGSRYGFVYGNYSYIFSKYFKINPRKIVLQKYSKQTISYKEWSKKEKAEEIIKAIKQKTAYLEVKIGRKTVLAKITEYSSSAPKEWNLNPLEYIIYNENKPIGAIPMCVTKDNVPVNIEQLNKKQKQYIRFFD